MGHTFMLHRKPYNPYGSHFHVDAENVKYHNINDNAQGNVVITKRPLTPKNVLILNIMSTVINNK